MANDRAQDLSRLYPIEIRPEESTEGTLVYMALHPDLPGCMAHGDTPEEALSNLSEARDLYIPALVERGLRVPKPRRRRGRYAA